MGHRLEIEFNNTVCLQSIYLWKYLTTTLVPSKPIDAPIWYVVVSFKACVKAKIIYIFSILSAMPDKKYMLAQIFGITLIHTAYTI